MAGEQKIISQYFDNIPLEVEPYILQYLIDPIVKHTISKMLAYRDSDNTFQWVQVNSSGELLVSLEAGQVSTGTIARATVSNVALLLLASNVSRKQAIIQNVGTEDIYIGFDSGLNSGNGFLLPVGTTFQTDIYVGNIYGIRSSTVDGSVHIMEF